MVDATPSKSNQHEIGTTIAMRAGFLGTEDRKFTATYLWLSDNEEALSDFGSATHYDSRKNKPHRSAEWRLYYAGNSVTDLMAAGDTLFLAKIANKEHLLFVIVKPGSTHEQQLLWLFGLQRPIDRFEAADTSKWNEDIGFAGQLILDELGIEPQIDQAHRLDQIVSGFNGVFPSTKIFSALARETCNAVDPITDPDTALEAWLSHEEALFRRLELHYVRKRLETGFADGTNVDIEGFLSFSLSVQNKRKSRMGLSFEHHLAALFEASGIRFSRHSITEHGQKPDFVFPSGNYYQKADIGDPQLAMLAVKSTCKDRWRQILPEAQKIPVKHLATIEPGISENQTDQMSAYNVQLVVPKGIAQSYSTKQQSWLCSISDFIALVKSRQ